MRQCGLHPTNNHWNTPIVIGGDLYNQCKLLTSDVIVVSLTDYEGVSEVWQLVPSDMFSLISIPFQGKSAVKVGVSNDHVI